MIVLMLDTHVYCIVRKSIRNKLFRDGIYLKSFLLILVTFGKQCKTLHYSLKPQQLFPPHPYLEIIGVSRAFPTVAIPRAPKPAQFAWGRLPRKPDPTQTCIILMEKIMTRVVDAEDCCRRKRPWKRGDICV